MLVVYHMYAADWLLLLAVYSSISMLWSSCFTLLRFCYVELMYVKFKAICIDKYEYSS